MEATARIEQALEQAIGLADAPGAPPRLVEAIRYAVFPGGARIRPRLCLAVAAACGDDVPELSDAAAAAIELMHCASLVHDDLPCFDDAGTRRGKPSVHRAFGEPLAVLTGDAMILLAFQTLARAGRLAPDRLGTLIGVLGTSVGLPCGIVGGQAWECEPDIPLEHYHRSKTGALFAGATMAGAVAAGRDGPPWRGFGQAIGEAYQVADDIRDAAGDAAELGKPIGRDLALARPSAATDLGLAGAVARLKTLVAAAAQAVPPCPGADGLRDLMAHEARRFLPKGLSERLAA